MLRYAGTVLLAALLIAPSMPVQAQEESGAAECARISQKLRLTPAPDWRSDDLQYRVKLVVLSAPLRGGVGKPGQMVDAMRYVILASHVQKTIDVLREDQAAKLEAETGGPVKTVECEPDWGLDGDGVAFLYQDLLLNHDGKITFGWGRAVINEQVAVPRVPARRPDKKTIADLIALPDDLGEPTIIDVLPPPADIVDDTAPPVDDVADIPPPPTGDDLIDDLDPRAPVTEPRIDLTGIDREKLASLDVEVSRDLPLYKGIAAMNLSLVVPGMSVLAIEKMDCSPKGNFFIASFGTLVAPPEGAEPELNADGIAVEPQLRLTRSSRLAANNYFGTVENTESIAELIGSTTSDRFWCVPKKEFCYETIGFKDYGAKGRAGDTINVKRGWVFSAENSLIMAFAAAVSDLCAVNPVGVAK